MVGKLNFKALGIGRVMNRFRDLQQYETDSTYYVGTDVEYAAYVEFGTSRMQPQPFLRPAVREVKGNLGRHTNAGDPDQVLKSIATDVESKAKRRCPVDTGNLRGSIKTWQE